MIKQMKGGFLKMNKKGQIGTLQSVIVALVTVGILLGIAFMVLEEFRDNMTAGTNAYSGVNDTINALNNIPTWLGIIVILAVVGILLAIVFSVLPRQGASV